MILLYESKRDDLLLPYLNILKERGIEMPLGMFKAKMLNLLSNGAGINRVSEKSNYYLAGATRYYFEGQLTLNKDLAIFKQDEDAMDTWNSDVCVRLNAVIGILRNAYIDTIGQTFEQPEDFGTLSLPKLLRKYNKKINAELGIQDEKPEKEEKDDGLDRNDRCSKNYTFEIMYSQVQCQKYNQATSPGAWCITYTHTDQHYKSYIRMLDIHYVIFKRDGWENVPREKQEEKWKGNKPQDDYGNSLIALLQSNTNGEPIYITSRWNHGWGSVSCEADHAYTKEEFMQITGVDDAQLQRIFEIWKKDKNKYKQTSANKEDRAEENLHRKEALRSLKYIQMRINGGEDPASLVHVAKALTANGDGKLSKNIVLCTLGTDNGSYYYLMDRGKIIFDTFMDSYTVRGAIRSDEYFRIGDDEVPLIKDSIIITTERYFMVYNMRLHSLLEIEGVKKFKTIPDRWSTRNRGDNLGVFTLKVSGRQIALVNASTNMPIKLPNGHYWFEEMYWYGKRRWGRRQLESEYISNNDGMIELLYDSASREKYFYSMKDKMFIDVPKENGKEGVLDCDFDSFNGIYAIKYITDPDARYWGRSIIRLFAGKEQISLEGFSEFSKVQSKTDSIVAFMPLREESDSDYGGLYYAYDFGNAKIVRLNGEPLRFTDATTGGYRGKSRTIFFRNLNGRTDTPNDDNYYRHYYLYDTQRHIFVKNPLGFPSEMVFSVYDDGDEDGKRIRILRGPQTGWNFGREEMVEYTIDDLEAQMGIGQDVENNSPAYSINESDIHRMVAESVRKLLDTI